MSTEADFSKKSLIIITGASQGIGQKIAQVVAGKLKDDSRIALIARSEKGLLETKNLIHLVNKNISVDIHSSDLSKPNSKDYDEIFNKLSKDSFENVIIFHNAGQVGLLKDASELNDLELWRNYYDLNLFSVTLLNSAFLKNFKGKNSKLYFINITSLCGRKPFANMSLYGSAKAARELYFSVLAVEESDIVVLQYSPGPVDTAMFNTVVDTAENTELKATFTDMKKNKVILSTNQTVEKLFGILESGKFKSGDVLDYFDV